MTLPTGSAVLAEFLPARDNYIYYLSNWSVKNQLIYIETPKVGCTSIKQILQYSELEGDSTRLPQDIHSRPESPLLSPKGREKEFISCLLSDDYFVFSFVRNPFTRTLSAYLDKVIGRPGVTTPIQKQLGIDPEVYIPTFAEFVDLVYNTAPVDMNPHWAPQTFLLGMDKVRYDFLGRFESFNASVEQLIARKGLLMPRGALSHGKEHATGAGARVQNYYTPVLVKKIQEVFSEDFRYLGYGWSL